jgi:hypothetical protein
VESGGTGARDSTQYTETSRGEATSTGESSGTTTAEEDHWWVQEGGYGTMMRVKHVEMKGYNPHRYGLLKARKRLTRVRFQTVRGGTRKPYRTETPDRSLRLLLPEIYDTLAMAPMAPMELQTERIRAEWDEDEQAFILHHMGLIGFEVVATIGIRPDEIEDDADTINSGAVEALHGAELPRVAG